MMLGTNSDIPASIMGLVSTYLASFFLFCKLPFKWYLAIELSALANWSQILDEEILDDGTRPLCCPGGAEKSGSLRALEQH